MGRVPRRAEGLSRPRGGPPPDTIECLPSPLRHPELLRLRLAERCPVVFLDYDGTLTPIVADPRSATLPAATRREVERLASRCPVAIVSGRDLRDVRAMVGLDSLVYAGSHGFDVGGTFGGRPLHAERGTEALPALDRAERALREELAELPGARVERKRLAIAVHVRGVDAGRVPEAEAAVARAAEAEPDLRATSGKMVLELWPALDWDKGAAVRWLLSMLGLDRDDVVPVYVGDDATDEDAFRALRDRGVGVVVGSAERPGATWARFALRDPSEVRAFLRVLAVAAEGEEASPLAGRREPGRGRD